MPAGADRGRRRNADAATALLRAAVDLLDDPQVGLSGLTMQAVALRAGVSKATLYRWWPDKAHLVLDAYRSKSARDIDTAAVVGDLRADLTAHLGHIAYALDILGSARSVAAITLAAAADGPFGALYRETLLRERRQALMEVLLAARRRGQVRSRVDLEVVVDAAYGAIHHRLLLSRGPIDGPFVTALVEVLVAGVTVTRTAAE